ncbi:MULTISPECIES: hypothetical protein [Brevibacterium]|uniref:hypothetical protein n=1 Tax=Brevibacterium TaxID=1696 RepID=UPI000C396826|nr:MULTISPECIES: hypothetical protein [Brevibacterium]SMY04385.1 hypothetical protein BSP239C_03821 [Brevibacterium sp. 239c]
MSRLSLTRTGSSAYQSGYLRSQQWHWRRRRWFRDRRAAGFEPACQVCGVSLEDAGTLDLHHVSYDGVVENPDGSWTAREADEDLMPLCRDHHQAVHRIMDRKRDFHGWDRRRATLVIVAFLRAKWEKK